jgi:ABC-type Mn2+/Zn2+ transport system ATPase subunit
MGAEQPVVIDKLSYNYNHELKVIEDFKFEMKKGEITAIMGPNGSGKTTLIKLMMGLLTPYKGNISIFGHSPAADKLRVQKYMGYMPQREHVSSKVPLRVRDVVLMGRLARGGAFKLVSGTDIKAAKEAMEFVDMSEFWDNPFYELSGGQQQRVLFARALAVEPKILLLDEPFSAMDVPSQNKIIDILRDLADNYSISIGIITHDVNNILHQIDKVLLMNHKVIGFGKPEDVLVKNNLLTAYGAMIKIIVCEEGVCHPLVGDLHG